MRHPVQVAARLCPAHYEQLCNQHNDPVAQSNVTRRRANCETATACTTSDSTAISGSDCKCAAASSTNECVAGKFCWADNTCNDAPAWAWNREELTSAFPLQIGQANDWRDGVDDDG